MHPHKDIMVSWKRLETTAECIPHPCWTYMKSLSIFICCGWVYWYNLTQLYMCIGGLNLEILGQRSVMVEVVNHCSLHQTSILMEHEVFGHLYLPCVSIWVYPYTAIPMRVMAKFWQINIKWSLTMTLWCHRKTVYHQWLHPNSILDVYEVFGHLHMLWMGIWEHPYTVIPVQL
jgi:hypothetical protein